MKNRFNQHRGIGKTRTDIRLSRAPVLDRVVDGLRTPGRVWLVGPDNMGKSTLVHLLEDWNDDAAEFVMQSLSLARPSISADPRDRLVRGLHKLARRVPELRGLEDALRAVRIDQLERFASEVHDRTGRPLCLVLDDLYRFHGSWDRFPGLVELMEVVRDSAALRWLVCDNDASDELASRLPGARVRVDIGPLTEAECFEFLERGFPALGQDLQKSARRLHEQTGGSPHLVMRVAARLADAGRPVPDAQDVAAAIQRVGEEPDVAYEKVRDLAFRDPSASRLVTEATAHRQAIVTDEPERRLAARALVATGFFVMCGGDSPPAIRAANWLFARWLADGMELTPGTPVERQIAGGPTSTLPARLRDLRRLEHNRSVLLRLALRHVARAPYAERLPSFLGVIETMFDLRWSALFFAPELPPRRIVVAGVRGAPAKRLAETDDGFGWAPGVPHNDWLRAALDAAGPIVISPPFESAVVTPPGPAAGALRLDARWQTLAGEAAQLLAIPCLRQNGRAAAVLVVATGDCPLDAAQAGQLARACHEIEGPLAAALERRDLRRRGAQLHQAMDLVSQSVRAPSTSLQLDELCRGLRRMLRADYADVCQATSDGFIRIAKAWSDEFDEIGPQFGEFQCRYRTRALDASRAGSLISNDSSDGPTIPPESRTERLRVSLARRCGGGFTLLRETVAAIVSDAPPERVRRRLVELEGQSFVSEQSLENALGKLRDDEQTASWCQRIVTLVRSQGMLPVEGVVTVGFLRPRILSWSELQLVDMASDMAAHVLGSIRERNEVAELYRTCVAALVHKPVQEGLRALVVELVRYLGTSHCSLSLKQSDGITRAVASVGYKEGYEGLSYPPSAGRTGYVMDNARVLRQIFLGGAEVEDRFDVLVPPHTWERLPREQIDRYLHGSRCHEFVEAQRPPEVFVGIPMVGYDESGCPGVIGCVKLLQLPGEPDLTEDKVAACEEIAQLAATHVTLLSARSAVAARDAEVRALEAQQRHFRRLAHDLGTPIAGIDTELSLLRGILDDNASAIGDVREAIDERLANVERRNRHLDSVAGFARVAREHAPRMQDVSLGQVLATHVERFRHEKNLTVTWDIRDDGARLRCDPDHVERAVDNLMTNAREAGATVVRLCAWAEGGCAFVTVEDDGHGFATDDAAQVWSPYYTTKSAAGAGQGLAIVRDLVEANRGQCLVPTRETRWTRFGFTLPVVGDVS